MSYQRSDSFKRSREEHPAQRPAKRSPRNSQIFVTPPSTPKRHKRFPGLNPKAKLITSFQKVFNKSSFVPITSSPESLSSAETETSEYFPNPLQTPPTEVDSSDIADDSFSFISFSPVERSLNQIEHDFQYQLSNLTLKKRDGSFIPQNQPHQIFQMPEILLKIISYVDDFTVVPHEESPVRRRPLSYQHALLIYNDEKKASKIWNEQTQTSIDSHGIPPTSFATNTNNLFNCFLVNKLWHQVTMELATTKHFFMDYNKWSSFIDFRTRTPLKRSKSNTRLFIMHKLSKIRQSDVEKVSPMISGQLEWIEMYVCPKILPTPSMLSGSLLKKLILPGSKLINDSFLKLVAKSCPLLENLDLRECMLVSDIGVMRISRSCQNLKFLNLGRHSNADLITDRSLFSISMNNPKITTLGLAGCSITDRGLWEVSTHCSNTIERLSLNKCSLLTNSSIPRIIENGYLPNLTVLEIRHILSLTNMKPLVQFKRYQELFAHRTVLIEGCEVLEYRMRQEEWRIDMKNSAKMFKDIITYCNQEDDGDLTYSELMDRGLI